MKRRVIEFDPEVESNDTRFPLTTRPEITEVPEPAEALRQAALGQVPRTLPNLGCPMEAVDFFNPPVN